MKIVNNVALLRRKQGITQEELAKTLNLSRQSIISIENNNNNISLMLAFKIASHFNKDILEVFKERKDMDNLILNTLEKVQEKFGKNTIIIKGDLLYRCSTSNLEICPKSVLDYKLPKYGKMRKFVCTIDGVFELEATRDYKNENDRVLHKKTNKANIDPSFIDFDKTQAHNYK